MRFDLNNIGNGHLELLDMVVTELNTKSDVTDSSLMVVGAQCRDLLHVAFGHDSSLRATNDLDLAVAISGWGQYQALSESFPRSGDTDIRFSVAGIEVDFVPFGSIEDPAGTARMPGRREEFDVFAFDEVFVNATVLPLIGGAHIKLPTPQGYTALKLKAWCDRSKRHEYKDASDLAVACFWHMQDEWVIDELYDTEEGISLLVESGMSVDRAAVKLLGRRVATEIGVLRTVELRDAWQTTDAQLLAENLATSVVGGTRLQTDASALLTAQDLVDFMAVTDIE